MREGARSTILERRSRADVLRPTLAAAEVNDLIDYVGWQFWDMLSLRATEGESGLIPRQEYEALGLIEECLRYEELLGAVTSAVGAEGVIEIGERARGEIGSKVNVLHEWLMGAAPLLGRGLLLQMGVLGPDESRSAITTWFQFMQRVLWGHRGDGFLFSSQCDYRALVLDDTWTTRLRREAVEITSDDDRRVFREVNAATELLAFLCHMDCRLGLCDSGPYDVGDGEVMIVRDHFLWEDVFDWCDVCEDLPYAVTLGLVLRPPPEGLAIHVNDISTTFTTPPNYLPYITRVALFARPRWDSPVAEIRPLSLAEAGALTRAAKAAVLRLYRRFSRMSRRQLVTNGLYVYHVDMILPFLRAAGIYEQASTERGLWDIARTTSDAYFTVHEDGYAQKVIPYLFMSGDAFARISE